MKNPVFLKICFRLKVDKIKNEGDHLKSDNKNLFNINEMR